MVLSLEAQDRGALSPWSSGGHLPTVSVHLGKGNGQTMGGLLDTGSKFILVLRDPKHCYGAPAKVETLDTRVK
jgi:hypothetical protein